MKDKIEDVLNAVTDAQTAGQEPQKSWGSNNVGWTRKENTPDGFRVFELRLPPSE